ncbi:CBS domain-containing protein [Priestia koreensis]|uniref:CBS domain-containing protein n=1 Tax=Priestia koreensis TaxID=284581 RepID=UPI001F55FFFD|nr:CBS domain-containing protein [Priestia koreensis]MCM3004183.1 CBS domain-containing protein [Priestia koreensis]UNL83401.1 CBS domain-containing protein [Priestia koreensis]
MNVAFFLIPKIEVVTVNIHSSMRQALEKMEYHRYAAVPLIDDEGKYVGTLTEGDILWKIKSLGNFNMFELEDIPISDVARRQDNKPISINDEMTSIISQAAEQNFVPVVDDNGVFIGIIRRREIIELYASELLQKQNG